MQARQAAGGLTAAERQLHEACLYLLLVTASKDGKRGGSAERVVLALLLVPGHLLPPSLPSEEKVLGLMLQQQALKAHSSEWASGFPSCSWKSRVPASQFCSLLLRRRVVLHGDQGDLCRDDIPSGRRRTMTNGLDAHVQLAGSGMEAAQTPLPRLLFSGLAVTFLGAVRRTPPGH